jgi:Mrp family chromosome partitioning ATPase
MSCQGCPSKGNCSKDAASCGLQPNPNNKIKYIVAVMSGKGGVGKSTVSVMLARALAKMNLKVGILDADLTGPSIPRMCGLENEHAFANENQMILPVTTPDGIKTISINNILSSESDPVLWRGPVLTGVLHQLYTDVLWGELDVLLIDMPPGTGDVALTILQDFPVSGVVMVSTPQPMVSMIVSKAIVMCEKMQIPVLGVIENMAWMDCPHCKEKILFYNENDLEDFLQSSKTKLYAELPTADVLRSYNLYDQKDLKGQLDMDAYLKNAAEELWSDLNKKR